MSEVSSGKMKQPYHLVEPSIWPLFGSIAGGLLTAGGVLYLHDYTDILLPIGFVAVLATMFFWWRSVIKEGTILKQHSPIVSIGLRYGMLLFICSEVMFFVAFFWAYFDPAIFFHETNQITRFEFLGGQWPPKGVHTFDPFDIPFLNTMILLLSGCTVTWAHHAVLANDQKSAVQGLTVTVLLGMLFTSLQVFEYAHAAFGFRDGIYSSAFFMATGFHGFHVMIGTIFLAVCLFRARAGHFTPERHFGLEAAAWYWHFVDVVWLFLFVCIYWWGAGDLPAAH